MSVISITLTNEQVITLFQEMMANMHELRSNGNAGAYGIYCCHSYDESDGKIIFVYVHDNNAEERTKMFSTPLVVKWEKDDKEGTNRPYLISEDYIWGEYLLHHMSEQLGKIGIKPIEIAINE